MILESALLWLYKASLRLYPRPFRQEFAAEMAAVFSDALGSARCQGMRAVLRLCGREVAALPAALAREHWQASPMKEAGMDKVMPGLSAGGPAGPEFQETPARGWREIVPALLPFVFFLALDLLPRLLAQDSQGQGAANILLGVFGVASVLAALVLAWRGKWPAWSAAWVALFVFIPLALAVQAAVALLGRQYSALSNNLGMYFALPLAIAVPLYSVTRLSPRRGLLAALPLLYALWQPNMEFVPDGIEFAIKLPSLALFCLAAVYLLRQPGWGSGLLVVLGLNLAVGALFSYAGIYHRGMLPFSAPGPNLVEVLRALLPHYLATGGILLGPLFAMRIRQLGRLGGPAGQAGYHLALAGLLLVILANLGGIMVGTTDDPSNLRNSLQNLSPWVVLAGLLAYLAGLWIVYRDLAPSYRAGAARLGLLALLPLAIPVTFTLPFLTNRWPVSELYGTALVWALPHGLSLGLGLAWLALSVWVVLVGVEPARPAGAQATA